MKRTFSRLLGGFLASIMLSGVAVAGTPSESMVRVYAASSELTLAQGWYETIYAEWSNDADAANAKVEYKASSDSAYTTVDSELVRATTNGGGRVDIPGLAAGDYDIRITTSAGEVLTQSGISVSAYDRSGYAHFNYSEGVGAYNNDGTPKDNAIIVYVTNANKDTVTIPGYEDFQASTANTNPAVGIGNILNNNLELMNQVTVVDNHPLIFRFIGTVELPKNLTPHGEKDPILGGSTSDNGAMAIVKKSRNITIEGIGNDATLDGWGITFSMTDTQDPSVHGYSYEVRNLTFENYPEDALGFQGDQSGSGTSATLTHPIQRVWVHNNSFYPGYCSNPTESDKKEGDGSCDFKRGQYYTMSYNYFENCHKTNLIGSGGSDVQYNMTLHHNYYKNVGSRQPLTANGNVHMYNNYFVGASSTTTDLRNYAMVFSENNYYEDCKDYFKLRNNTCHLKAYGNIIEGGDMGSNSGSYVVATSRSEAALADNGLNFPDGTSMANFDTNPDKFYYSNGASDVEVMLSASQVKSVIPQVAGPLKDGSSTEQPDAPEESTETTTQDPSGGDDETETTTSAPVVSGGYEHNFELNNTESDFYNITGNLSTSKGSVTYNGVTISQCLKLESSTSITFTAPAAGTLVLVLGTDDAGARVKIDGTNYTADSSGILTTELGAGSHEITKGDTANLFYMNFAVEGAETDSTTESTTASTTESTTESTTASTTESTTEATTASTTESTTEATTASTTESTTEPTTEAPTEPPTEAPISGVGVSVGDAQGTVGTAVSIPVSVSGMDDLAAADMTISYDASKLNVTSVTLGSDMAADASLDYSIADGTIKVALVNPRDTLSGNEILVINATLLTEGSSEVNAVVNYLYGADLAPAEDVNVTSGTVTANPAAPERIMGDANGDGEVNADDVTHILQYVTHKIADVVDRIAADVTGDGKVTVRDANKIQKYVLGKITSLD